MMENAHFGEIGAFSTVGLFSGTAAVRTNTGIAGEDILQHSPVAVGSDGMIYPLVMDAGNLDTKKYIAIGISQGPVNAGDNVGFYISGDFNPDAISWHPVADTIEKRKAVFYGTMININKVIV